MSNLSQSMTESMRTVCVGRYTIDLPRSAAGLKIGQKINGIRIEAQYPANTELLKRKVAEDAKPGAGKSASTLTGSPNSLLKYPSSVSELSSPTRRVGVVFRKTEIQASLPRFPMV
ncbi:hypothetical protein [Burkholderia glumae]|uniref:hypothetical protein n=1 Tax=Burkholderia glumae TaxID=337 RepID=UPI00148EA373|nr:hypothetical protein [Burkholderia glumae]QJW80748.1 hypothetical protein GAS18_18580 [Burkholderia glumae]